MNFSDTLDTALLSTVTSQFLGLLIIMIVHKIVSLFNFVRSIYCPN